MANCLQTLLWEAKVWSWPRSILLAVSSIRWPTISSATTIGLTFFTWKLTPPLIARCGSKRQDWRTNIHPTSRLKSYKAKSSQGVVNLQPRKKERAMGTTNPEARITRGRIEGKIARSVVRRTRISENHEEKGKPHPLRHFEIFGSHRSIDDVHGSSSRGFCDRARRR